MYVCESGGETNEEGADSMVASPSEMYGALSIFNAEITGDQGVQAGFDLMIATLAFTVARCGELICQHRIDDCLNINEALAAGFRCSCKPPSRRLLGHNRRSRLGL